MQVRMCLIAHPWQPFRRAQAAVVMLHWQCQCFRAEASRLACHVTTYLAFWVLLSPIAHSNPCCLPPFTSEFKRWCPTLRVVRLHSTDQEERKRLVREVSDECNPKRHAGA